MVLGEIYYADPDLGREWIVIKRLKGMVAR